MSQNNLEQSIRHCYGAWSAHYYDDYYQSDVTYPPIHTDIIRNLLEQSEARSLLDAGCGPASMLRDLNLPNLQRFGFDLTPEMVAEARRVLSLQQVPPSHVWEGNVLDACAFRCPDAAAPTLFDAAICFGVLPHIPASADSIILTHLLNAVRPGGWVACEARNQLFALFTLNRYTSSLFRQELIQSDNLSDRLQDPVEKAALAQALSELDKHFRMDLPPPRKSYADEPSYDEVLSRTHNPFELLAEAQKAGWADVQVLFYHYHCLPPMFESLFPHLFRRESLALENPKDWRGYFMASAFIVLGKRP